VVTSEIPKPRYGKTAAAVAASVLGTAAATFFASMSGYCGENGGCDGLVHPANEIAIVCVWTLILIALTVGAVWHLPVVGAAWRWMSAALITVGCCGLVVWLEWEQYAHWAAWMDHPTPQNSHVTGFGIYGIAVAAIAPLVAWAASGGGRRSLRLGIYAGALVSVSLVAVSAYLRYLTWPA